MNKKLEDLERALEAAVAARDAAREIVRKEVRSGMMPRTNSNKRLKREQQEVTRLRTLINEEVERQGYLFDLRVSLIICSLIFVILVICALFRFLG